jgi:hypothetical protein
VLVASGKIAEAPPSYQKAIDIRRKLADADAGNAD